MRSSRFPVPSSQYWQLATGNWSLPLQLPPAPNLKL
jgi:hypothetical protein